MESNNIRMDQMEERICDLECRHFEISQSEQNKGIILKNSKKAYMNYSIATSYQLLDFQKEERGRGRQNKYSKK